MESIGFSSFRRLLDIWDESVSKRDKINSILNGNDLVLFFTKEEEVYGAPESSRVTFARMKHPDDENDKGWAEEANFLAFNLDKALQGEESKMMFTNKDISKIKIVDKEGAEAKLMNKKMTNPKLSFDNDKEDHPAAPAPNIQNIDDN